MDKWVWLPWFTLQHEEYQLDVSLENVMNNDEPMQVKLSMSAFGVECLRCVFAFADSNNDRCTYSFLFAGNEYSVLGIVEEWIRAAFSIEIVVGGAKLFDHSRQMGAKYVTFDEMADVTAHFQDAMKKLVIQRQHMDHENNVPEVASDRYSAFACYYDLTNLEERFTNG